MDSALWIRGNAQGRTLQIAHKFFRRDLKVENMLLDSEHNIKMNAAGSEQSWHSQLERVSRRCKDNGSQELVLWCTRGNRWQDLPPVFLSALGPATVPRPTSGLLVSCFISWSAKTCRSRLAAAAAAIPFTIKDGIADLHDNVKTGKIFFPKNVSK